jgi:hypothetical protein
MRTPHKWAKEIRAYAEGYDIQYRGDDAEWVDIECPSFNPNCQYRIKPEREYPVTSMTWGELQIAYNGGDCNHLSCIKSVANAAIRRYIEDEEKKNDRA